MKSCMEKHKHPHHKPSLSLRQCVETEPRLTVKEAVVFEATPTEERMEGVQALLSLDRFGVWAVDVGRALRGKGAWELLLSQLLIPAHSLK